MLVDEATVEVVFHQDAGAIDNGAAIEVVVENINPIVGDGIAHVHGTNNLSQPWVEVEGVVNPQNHREIDGKHQAVKRGVEKQVAAIAGAYKSAVDLLFRRLLKKILMVCEAKLDGEFEQGFTKSNGKN